MSIEMARFVLGGRVIDERGANVDMDAVVRDKQLAMNGKAPVVLAIPDAPEQITLPPTLTEPAEPVVRPWDLQPLDGGDADEPDTFDAYADDKGLAAVALALALMLPARPKALPPATAQHTNHF